MRRIEKMPTPGTTSPGETATFNLPLGPTYHRLNIRLTAAASGGTPALVPAADWGNYIGEIRLMVNGDTRIEIDAADLVKLNQYHGQALDNGVLPLFLSQPWMRTPAGEDNTAYGTAAGMASFTLEIDLVSGVEIGSLTVYAVQSGPMAFGPHLRIQRFSGQTALIGTKEVSDLPLGAYNMMAMHITSANIDKVEILADNVKVIEMDQVIRQAHLQVIGKVPQAGMTHIDFLAENRLAEALPMALTDFRAKLDFTAANQSYKIYQVSLQGVI